MNFRPRMFSVAVMMVLVMASGAALAHKLDGAQYLKEARVSLTQARATALKVVAGKIVAEELEKETGGSGLRYSFDIKLGGVTHEVGIDASTGKVLENSVENAAEEANEAAQESKAHKTREAHEDNDGDEDESLVVDNTLQVRANAC